MPKDLNDVLTLLTATLQASQTLSIPLISMSMGPLGSLTRLFGCAFGSALTFAVGASSSAPGQVPIEDLNTVLAIVQRSMSSR
jgi:3-dehydroquinate dehydratase-1